MNIFARRLLKKVNNAYRNIEKYCVEYPGSKCFLIIECEGYSKETMDAFGVDYHAGIFDRTTQVVLDENKKPVFSFRKPGIQKNKQVHVYDSNSHKIGAIIKKEKLLKSNRVIVKKSDNNIYEISADNKSNTGGIRHKHSMFGISYNLYKNDKLIIYRNKGIEVCTIVMMDNIDETEGILLAAAMNLLYTESHTGGGDSD